jgi:DNA-binding transcriptional regulator PaaX
MRILGAFRAEAGCCLSIEAIAADVGQSEAAVRYRLMQMAGLGWVTPHGRTQFILTEKGLAPVTPSLPVTQPKGEK